MGRILSEIRSARVVRSSGDMSTTIRSYRDLIVWQKAMDLANLVYDMTDRFPPNEQFGLTFQMRKAAVSIPSNIAEGSRHRTAGYVALVVIALGEHAELETQAMISDRRGYLRKADREKFWSLSTEVGQLAHGLLRSLEAQLPPQQIPGHQSHKSQIPNP